MTAAPSIRGLPNSLPLLAGAMFGDCPVGYLADVAVQICKRIELPVTAGSQVVQADLGRFTKGFETRAILRLPTLHQAKAFPQNLAGILISTRVDQLFDQLGLMFGKNDISCRHDGSSAG